MKERKLFTKSNFYNINLIQYNLFLESILKYYWNMGIILVVKLLLLLKIIVTVTIVNRY